MQGAGTVLSHTHQEQRLLEKTKFYAVRGGKYIELFFRNNPWKLCESNGVSKVHRYCVVCGEDRYGDEAWKKVLSRLWGAPLATCRGAECLKKQDDLYDYVSMNFFELYDKEMRFRKSSDRSQFRIDESFDGVLQKEERVSDHKAQY